MRLSLLLAATALTTGLAQAQDLAQPELLGEIVLPTGLLIDGVEFGGISGLDYDAASGLFYAISDDRSQRAPARFYTLRLDIDEEGFRAVDIVSTRTLLTEAGEPFAENGVDPEAIRYHAGRNSLFWSSEGDADGKPAIFEAGLDGKVVRQLAVPDAYMPAAEGTRGVYGNLAFESLALSGDGSVLYAGTENALAQDGDKATLEAGSPSRVIVFDVETGAPTTEFVYLTDPIFAKATAEPGYNDNGLSDFLMLDADRLVTVERSFGSGLGNEINFYVASLAGAAEVGGAESIKDSEIAPLAKTAWFSIGEGDFGLDIDNIESITFGPAIGDRRSLVIASDNNFNADGQFTQFVVFAVPAAL